MDLGSSRLHAGRWRCYTSGPFESPIRCCLDTTNALQMRIHGGPSRRDPHYIAWADAWGGREARYAWWLDATSACRAAQLPQPIETASYCRPLRRPMPARRVILSTRCARLAGMHPIFFRAGQRLAVRRGLARLLRVKSCSAAHQSQTRPSGLGSQGMGGLEVPLVGRHEYASREGTRGRGVALLAQGHLSRGILDRKRDSTCHH
jgi:hypothetical protein